MESLEDLIANLMSFLLCADILSEIEAIEDRDS